MNWAAMLILGLGSLANIAPPADAVDSSALTASSPFLSPAALAVSPDAKTLFIACATANQVLVFDPTLPGLSSSIRLPAGPSGLALSRDGSRLYITCAAPKSTVVIWDVARGSILDQIPTGHTAMAPVLSPDEATLFVCNRFNHTVSFLDLATRTETHRVAVAREPVAAAITPDGRYLLVANHLQAGRADADMATAVISVLDTAAGKVAQEIVLPNGSGLLREIRVSPDGKYAGVTHILARFHLPTVVVEEGWMNCNALTLIDLDRMTLVNTVLLDESNRGAANPWAAAWSDDGKRLCVTHAGTHELSVVDVPGVLNKLAQLPPAKPAPKHQRFTLYHRPERWTPATTQGEVPFDFTFLKGLRQRIALPGRGPRAIALAGGKAYIANYFSDCLSVVDLEDSNPQHITSIPLRTAAEVPLVRRGDEWFNDGTLCHQGWQSCASCHDTDGRADALNWDLLNDGWNNPKNTRSLLLAHQTPPAMSLGVRETAATAVRAGMRKILFAIDAEDVPPALDAFLQSLKPIPSPYLVDGKLSPAAERGQRLFLNPQLGCAHCHTPPLFTNLKAYHVGTLGNYDKPVDKFDTPALIELWRTAPYLHDGSALTLREVLTTSNPEDRHGKTSHLTSAQIDDLADYLNSL